MRTLFISPLPATAATPQARLSDKSETSAGPLIVTAIHGDPCTKAQIVAPAGVAMTTDAVVVKNRATKRFGEAAYRHHYCQSDTKVFAGSLKGAGVKVRHWNGCY